VFTGSEEQPLGEMAPGVGSMHIVPAPPTGSEAQAIIARLDREILAIYPGQPVHGIDAAEFERTGGYFIVAKESAVIGCGAFRAIDRGRAEIKRMFVAPEARRRGVARSILRHLEAEIRRRGFSTIVLETGSGQPAAIGLYESEGFVPIPAYGEFVGNPISRCYEKKI
jgi:putative acetyltransferase